MATRKKVYDELPEIPYGTRPRVLLVGNGINLSFEGARNTDSIIQSEWKKSHNGAELPDRKDDSDGQNEIWKLPFTLQVVAATRDDVQSCMSELASDFKSSVISSEQKELIELISKTGFDSILTTNYSLEFEKSLIDDYSERKVYTCYRTTREQKSIQEKFGLFQCVELPKDNYPLLWHIHGTALRKESMIMGQLYYGKLLSEITARATTVNASYRAKNKKMEPYHPKSWVDYFLVGDVYIMGFNLDFSESDIWWLLSYKKSAFRDTRVYFYSPKIDTEKELMLDCYGVEIPNIPFYEQEEMKYVMYYERVCENLKKK